jgi:hypothetical protein
MQQLNSPETTVASELSNMSVHLAAARQAAYPSVPEAQQRRINLPLLLLVGLVLFALFFGIGYYLSTVFIK